MNSTGLRNMDTCTARSRAAFYAGELAIDEN